MSQPTCTVVLDAGNNKGLCKNDVLFTRKYVYSTRKFKKVENDMLTIPFDKIDNTLTNFCYQ